ncbi:MAG: hypothetical protein ACTSO5_10680 [Candidatus Heimdallarchaeaceae archaeon]
MAENQKSKFFFLGYIPRCPFYKPTSLMIILVLIALGTWGSYYLNIWAAVSYLVYSLLFYFVLMPFTMCKHCYFRIIESSTDEETGKTTKKLMDVDVWGKTLLHKHAGQKNWSWAMFGNVHSMDITYCSNYHWDCFKLLTLWFNTSNTFTQFYSCSSW